MADSIKAQLNDLILKREEIEGDVALRSERLNVAGVGLHGSLLDKEVSILTGVFLCLHGTDHDSLVRVPKCSITRRAIQGQILTFCQSGQTGKEQQVGILEIKAGKTVLLF